MTEIVIPSSLRIARSAFRYIDQTGVSRGAFSGAMQTTGYGGDRIGCSLDFTPTGGANTSDRSLRGQIKAALMATHGKQNRIFAEDNSTVLRGSFPASELLTNVDFSSTSGWTVAGGAMSVADGIARLSITGDRSNSPTLYQSATVTQYAPYVVRSMILQGSGLSTLSIGPRLDTLSTLLDDNLTTVRGYLLASGVVRDTTLGVYSVIVSDTQSLAGDYLTLSFTSASRCFLVDGASNQLLQSDAFGTSWSLLNGTVDTNLNTAPDNTATADRLVENSASNVEHYFTQAVTVPAGADDFSVSVSVKSISRTWCCVRMIEGTGSTSAYVFVSLSNGNPGTIAGGANFANPRAFVVDQGGGWYRITLIARKTNAATTIGVYLSSATADNTFTYAGSSSTVAIALWRGSFVASGVASRGAQTTTTAAAAETQAGSGIYVKGLPASTAGLLLLGDWVEIDGQLRMVMAPLSSDASGLGYLQFSPPLRRAVSDNTPIIVHRPMGRFVLAGDAGWNNVPGVFSDASLELEEAWS